jgi:prevent-host-death family protein
MEAAGGSMGEVTVKELKTHASALIRRVEAGERAVVTRHRRQVALLIPISEAREFVTAYANEFVAERESALDLGSRVGREVRGRFRVEVSSEVLEVAERRDFRRAHARAVLRRLAARAQEGNVRDWIRWKVFPRQGRGPVVVARAGHHLLGCEIDEGERRIRVLTAHRDTRPTRWMWVGEVPLRVVVADALAGRPWPGPDFPD